jgi:hypothetical protein
LHPQKQKREKNVPTYTGARDPFAPPRGINTTKEKKLSIVMSSQKRDAGKSAQATGETAAATSRNRTRKQGGDRENKIKNNGKCEAKRTTETLKQTHGTTKHPTGFLCVTSISTRFVGKQNTTYAKSLHSS